MFGRNPKFLFWKIESKDRNMSSSLNFFPWNVSTERIECSFDNTCRKFLSESLNIFTKIGCYPLKCQIHNKFIVFPTKYYFPNCLFGHVAQIFDNLAKNFVLKCLAYFRSKSWKCFTFAIVQRKPYSLKSSNQFVECNFDNRSEKFYQKAGNFSLLLLIERVFVEKKLFLKRITVF